MNAVNAGLAVTVVAGLAGIFLGWWLNVLTWRRQQLRDAYVALLAAADDFGLASGRMWVAAAKQPASSPELIAQASELQTKLQALDLTMGPMRLLGDEDAGAVSLDLYVQTEVMFRRAVNRPTVEYPRYEAAAKAWARAYQDLIDHGRVELGLPFWQRLRASWRVLLRRPRGESFFEMSERRLNQLNTDEPLDHPLDE